MFYPLQDKLQSGNLQMELDEIINFTYPGVKFKLLNDHKIYFAAT